MKNYLFSFIIGCLFINSSCKKKNHEQPAPNNNEIKATLLFSSGNTINFIATGSKAKMGCLLSLAGIGSYINGTNENNEAIYMDIFLNSSCITSPGTYNLSCEYRKNVADQNTPIWSSFGTNKASITYSVINDHYMEGSFNAVSRCVSFGCVFGVDSVIITGTFKGDYLSK